MKAKCKKRKNNWIVRTIKGLINLKYTFKISPKVKLIINGGFIFQFHDSVHSKILPIPLEMFFRHFI